MICVPCSNGRCRPVGGAPVLTRVRDASTLYRWFGDYLQ
jgi:hypothetical protein